MQLNFQFRGLGIDFSGFAPYCALLVREQVLEQARAMGGSLVDLIETVVPQKMVQSD